MVGVILPEIFQVGAIIAKLPSTWKSFSRKMMHKTEDFTMEELQLHLRIEEEARNRDNVQTVTNETSVMNVQTDSSRRKNSGPQKTKNGKHVGVNKPSFKKQKPKVAKTSKKNVKCHVCGIVGHYARECKYRKSIDTNDTKPTNKETNEIIAIVSDLKLDEVHMLTKNSNAQGGWILDSGATAHVVDNIEYFEKFAQMSGKYIKVGDGRRVEVKGIGFVKLRFTSGQIINLKDVLYVPSINKNIISLSKLAVNGYHALFTGEAVILKKNDKFVGKGYMNEGLYRLCVDNESETLNVINNVSGESSINKSSVVYLRDSLHLWHHRLAHINVKNIEKMKRQGFINFQNSDFNKCEICVKSKFTKSSFPSANRETTILELIHSDICELNGVLTRCGKR